MALLLVPTIIHQGRFPLYDVQARFVDLNKMKIDFRGSDYNIALGNLAPSLAAGTSARIPHKGRDLSFNIFFAARNGVWTQILRMRWIDNHGWARATMVTRFNKLLYRDVSDDFPQTPDGYPDWQEKAAIEFEQKGAAQNAAK